MPLSRRGFLSGLTSMLAAPAIVHAGNLMPVRGFEIDVGMFPKRHDHLTIEDIRAIVETMRNLPQWPTYNDDYILPIYPRLIDCFIAR